MYLIIETLYYSNETSRQREYEKVCNKKGAANDGVEQHRPRFVPRFLQLDHQDGSVIVSNGSANGSGYDCSNTMLGLRVYKQYLLD